jgi:hypothetical protein
MKLRDNISGLFSRAIASCTAPGVDLKNDDCSWSRPALGCTNQAKCNDLYYHIAPIPAPRASCIVTLDNSLTVPVGPLGGAGAVVA